MSMTMTLMWSCLAAFYAAAGSLTASLPVNDPNKPSPKPPLKSDDLYIVSEALFKRGSREHREVCFTFDDGPHPQSAEKLLDVLNQHSVKATFFVIGNRGDKQPAVLRRMVAEGHEIGNHTYSHPLLDQLKPAQAKREILNCEDVVREATGLRTRLFRPRGMRITPEILAMARNLGYVTVGWNVGAQDYEDAEYTPEEIELKVMKQVDNGSIILLHDNPNTVAALPRIFERLREQGYAFRTVGEMLARLPKPVKVEGLESRARHTP